MQKVWGTMAKMSYETDEITKNKNWTEIAITQWTWEWWDFISHVLSSGSSNLQGAKFIVWDLWTKAELMVWTS